MNQTVLTNWIAALRYNGYTQTTGKLRTETEFSALGILCDLHSKDTRTPWDHNCCYIGEKIMLPQAVHDWLSPDNRIEGEIFLKESDGCDLKEIAAYLEQTYKT